MRNLVSGTNSRLPFDVNVKLTSLLRCVTRADCDNRFYHFTFSYISEKVLTELYESGLRTNSFK